MVAMIKSKRNLMLQFVALPTNGYRCAKDLSKVGKVVIWDKQRWKSYEQVKRDEEKQLQKLSII